MSPEPTTDLVERIAAQVEREHKCDCEVCQRQFTLCPATTSSIIMELAERRLGALKAAAEIERLRGEVQRQHDGWSADYAVLDDACRARRNAEAARDALAAALREVVEAWRCSDGGAGGVEDIAAAVAAGEAALAQHAPGGEDG